MTTCAEHNAATASTPSTCYGNIKSNQEVDMPFGFPLKLLFSQQDDAELWFVLLSSVLKAPIRVLIMQNTALTEFFAA